MSHFWFGNPVGLVLFTFGEILKIEKYWFSYLEKPVFGGSVVDML
jgi:hypothetical protein